MNRQRKNWGRLFIFYTLLLLLIVMDACKKHDLRDRAAQPVIDPVEKFFDMPDHTHPAVRRMAAAMKMQNDREGFVPHFARNQGFLLWDKAKMFSSPLPAQARGGGGGDTSFIIPLVLENTRRVNGFVAALPRGGDSVLFKLYDATTYRYHFGDTDSAGIEAREMALITMQLEREVFNHSLFKILDTALFDLQNKPVKYLRLKDPAARLVQLGSWYVCYNVWVTNDNGQVVGCPPGDETCNVGASQTICENLAIYGFDDMQQGGGGGQGGSNPSGGGGDINSGWYNPCRSIDTIPGTSAGNVCTSGEPLGWISYTFEEDQFNPLEYDSVRISDDLRDSFPCIAALIEDTLFDINQKVQISMYDHFTVNQRNHTYFKVDWTMNCGSGPVAFTDHFGTGSTVGMYSHWTDTIRLNPCYLKKASKEFWVGTLMHETIHAYIWWCVKEFRRTVPWGTGLIDTAYMETHFPLHYEGLIAGQWDTTMHNLMASQYVRFIASVIYTHSNGSGSAALRRFVAENLAKAGLRQTSAWGKAPGFTDTCTIRAVGWSGQEFQNSGYGTWPYYLNCGIYTSLFRDSLQMQRSDSCQ